MLIGGAWKQAPVGLECIERLNRPTLRLRAPGGGPNAILESILEIRFDTTIPEILFGRFADFEPWRDFQQNRLPAYEIPDTLRQVDLNLRFAPVFELRDPKGQRSVRIGAHVLSYHQLAPYVGWNMFKPALSSAVEAVFSKSDAPRIQRLGFRYVNALRSDVHRIRGISDLNLKVAVAEEDLSDDMNLNFITALPGDAQSTVRVATTRFVQGTLPPGTTVVIDVDVSTREPLKARLDRPQVEAWLEVVAAGFQG